MKSVLVFTIAYFLFCLNITSAKAENTFQSFDVSPFPEVIQDTARQSTAPDLTSSIDMVLQQRSSRGMDHPVTLGETARDFGGGAFEHLAPLIFMVIAFLITIIAGSFLWERGYIWDKLQVPPPLEPRNRIPWATTILAALFALVTALLLWNIIGNYMANVHAHVEDDNHNIFEDLWKSHHRLEIILSLVAFLLLITVLFFQRSATVKRFIIPAAGLLELIVIIILLNVWQDHFYKLCSDNCVMHGSHAGISYDLPCADNIAFMTLHQTKDSLSMEEFDSIYVVDSDLNGGLPYFLDYASPVAIHDPIFPESKGDPVTFSLDEEKGHKVRECRLYIRYKSFTKNQVLMGLDFKEIDNAGADGTKELASWRRMGNRFEKTVPGATAFAPPRKTIENKISHEKLINGEPNKITYVTYKFEVSFVDRIQNPPQNIEITFVLQDYHEILPEWPAPVYAQGHMNEVLDILMIPANRPGEDVASQDGFANAFRKNSRLIIKDAVFKEPSLKFWRKQFNFWLNHQPGQVADARCLECCHDLPENFRTVEIPTAIDFKVLLHQGTQWDFTDQCNNVFSAEMVLVDNNDQQSSFLHELGHAAFKLSDEYPGGLNEESMIQLPNNWESLKGARNDARFRHKERKDARKLTF